MRTITFATWRTVLALTLIGAGFLSCEHVKTSPSQSQLSQVSKPRSLDLVWISLDALHSENLKPYLSRFKTHHPKGLKWLLSQTHSNANLEVGYPSITAPSHVSTMTCASPGQHGVFLNGGNWNGERNLSGFAMPYAAETWVQALRKDRKKVAVAAYPSVDGTSPERSADLGIAYDTPVGKVQYITLTADGHGQATVASHLIKGKVYQVRLKVEGKVVVATSDFGSDSSALAVGKAVDHFGQDGEGESTRQASIGMMSLGLQRGSYVVAVSPVSITPVQGAELRARLDAKKIVWSNLRDYNYELYENGASFALEALRHRRHAELAGIREMLDLGDFDALFAYFEDIDVILHAWIGLPEMEAQLAAFLQAFDHDLGEFITSLPVNTNLVIMGDHGMTAVRYELNARRFLPAGSAQHFQVRTSGGTMLLYPEGRLDSPVPAGLDLETVAQALRDATVEFDGNRKVFKRVVSKDSAEAVALGLVGPFSPWIMAFADEGLGLTDKLDQPLLVARRETFVIPEAFRDKYPDPVNSGRLVQPTPLGAHGHDSSLAAMRSHLVLLGPTLGRIDPAEVARTIDVVPTVADALGWLRPEGCRAASN